MAVMQVDACTGHIERCRRLIGGSGAIGIDAGGVGGGGVSVKLQGDTGIDTMITHGPGRTTQGRVAGSLDGEGKSIGKSRPRGNLKRKLGREVMNINLIF